MRTCFIDMRALCTGLCVKSNGAVVCHVLASWQAGGCTPALLNLVGGARAALAVRVMRHDARGVLMLYLPHLLGCAHTYTCWTLRWKLRDALGMHAWRLMAL